MQIIVNMRMRQNISRKPGYFGVTNSIDVWKFETIAYTICNLEKRIVYLLFPLRSQFFQMFEKIDLKKVTKTDRFLYELDRQNFCHHFLGQSKTLGTNWRTQLGYLFGYSKKPALSRLLIKLIKAISN